MKTIYHYTSVETLFKIFHNISNEKGEPFVGKGKPFIKMRANYFMNMNDPLDCTYFINEWLEYQKLNPTLKWKTIWEIGVPYFISFSAAKDNLPMWNMYGNKGHGVAIGFNEDAIRDCCNNNIGDVHHRAKMAMRSRKLYECKYWNKIEIKEFIQNCKIEEGKNDCDICSLSYLIKHPDYKYEKERRIVYLCNLNPKGPQTYIDFYIPLDAITEIICGPCADLDFVKCAVPDILKDFVKKSEVNYTDNPRKLTPDILSAYINNIVQNDPSVKRFQELVDTELPKPSNVQTKEIKSYDGRFTILKKIGHSYCIRIETTQQEHGHFLTQKEAEEFIKEMIAYMK